MEKKFGYARVSTTEQKLDRQIDALTREGCKPEDIFTEKMTGTKANRPQLDEMMRTVREGDTVVTESLSRLSRSTKDLLLIIEAFNEKKVKLISLKDNIDTSTPTGKMLLTILSALAQFERDLIAERTSEGLKAARARGRKGGRPRADNTKVNESLKLIDRGYSIAEAAKMTSISTATINRRIAERKKQEQPR